MKNVTNNALIWAFQPSQKVEPSQKVDLLLLPHSLNPLKKF